MITDLPTKGRLFKRYHGDKRFAEFYLQDGGKINWHRYGTKLRHSHSMYSLEHQDSLVPDAATQHRHSVVVPRSGQAHS